MGGRVKKYQDPVPKVYQITTKYVFIDPGNVDGASAKAFHVAGAASCNNDANTAVSQAKTHCGLPVRNKRIQHRCLSVEDIKNVVPNFKKNNETLCATCLAALNAPTPQE